MAERAIDVQQAAGIVSPIKDVSADIISFEKYKSDLLLRQNTNFADLFLETVELWAGLPSRSKDSLRRGMTSIVGDIEVSITPFGREGSVDRPFMIEVVNLADNIVNFEFSYEGNGKLLISASDATGSVDLMSPGEVEDVEDSDITRFYETDPLSNELIEGVLLSFGLPSQIGIEGGQQTVLEHFREVAKTNPEKTA